MDEFDDQYEYDPGSEAGIDLQAGGTFSMHSMGVALPSKQENYQQIPQQYDTDEDPPPPPPPEDDYPVLENPTPTNPLGSIPRRPAGAIATFMIPQDPGNQYMMGSNQTQPTGTQVLLPPQTANYQESSSSSSGINCAKVLQNPTQSQGSNLVQQPRMPAQNVAYNQYENGMPAEQTPSHNVNAPQPRSHATQSQSHMDYNSQITAPGQPIQLGNFVPGQTPRLSNHQGAMTVPPENQNLPAQNFVPRQHNIAAENPPHINQNPGSGHPQRQQIQEGQQPGMNYNTASVQTPRGQPSYANTAGVQTPRQQMQGGQPPYINTTGGHTPRQQIPGGQPSYASMTGGQTPRQPVPEGQPPYRNTVGGQQQLPGYPPFYRNTAGGQAPRQQIPVAPPGHINQNPYDEYPQKQPSASQHYPYQYSGQYQGHPIGRPREPRNQGYPALNPFSLQRHPGHLRGTGMPTKTPLDMQGYGYPQHYSPQPSTIPRYGPPPPQQTERQAGMHHQYPPEEEFQAPRRKQRVDHEVVSNEEYCESSEEDAPRSVKPTKTSRAKGKEKTSSTTKKTGDEKSGGKTTKPRKRNESVSDEEEDDDDDPKTAKKPSKPSGGKTKVSKPAAKKKIIVLKNPRDLRPLGRTELIPSTDPLFQTLETYAKNSSDMPESKGEVKVHKIYKFDHGPSQSSTPNAAAPTAAASSGPATTATGPKRLLLWYKTTPGSIKMLQRRQDGCIAFYDRLARAVPIRPVELTHPLRQTVLLFSVALGKIHEHRSGFKHWALTQFPNGSDSIKGIGKFTPDRRDNRSDDSTQIPCGKTVKHGKYSKYELDYNEYLIYELRRSKAKYAVDVEFIPNEEQGESEEEFEDGSDSD